VHDALFPADDLEVPIGQTVQASLRVFSVAPDFAKYPAVQVFAVNVVQDDEPAKENEPAEQVPEHVALVNPPDVAAPNVPAGQEVHDVNT
jgi:hypothetical protein